MLFSVSGCCLGSRRSKVNQADLNKEQEGCRPSPWIGTGRFCSAGDWACNLHATCGYPEISEPKELNLRVAIRYAKLFDVFLSSLRVAICYDSSCADVVET
jgi:hypothetical protein